MISPASPMAIPVSYTHLGWQQVTVEAPLGDWLYSYLLAYGDLLEVLAPEAVRKEMASRLQKAWQRYQI